MRAPGRGECIPPVPMENEKQVTRRRVAIVATETQSIECCERRRVYRVVPIRRDLSVLDHVPASPHQVVTVDLNVLQQLEVVSGTTDRDAHPGTRGDEPTVLEEDPLELPQDDVEHVRAGGKRNARNKLGHVTVDRGLPIATRERDSMVTVDHEVRLAELDRNDGWKGAVGVRASERAQPVTAERVQRPEVAGERVGATVRSDECVERDLANAQVTATERLQPPLDVGELEQTAAAERRHLTHQVPEPCGSDRSGVASPSARSPSDERLGRPRQTGFGAARGAGPIRSASVCASRPTPP